MSNHKRIQKYIKSIYFKLMTDEILNNYEGILKDAISELSKMIGAKYVGIYTNNDFEKKYSLAANESVETAFFLTEIKEKKSVIMNIETSTDNKTNQLRLLIIGNTGLAAEDLLVIKQEIEDLLKFTCFIKNKVESNQKNEHLYWLSSYLYSSTDKHVVLSRIVESLENTFHNYTHCLLLSHEFDESYQLPIRSIDFGDAETKRNSSTAFITGEVQIDHIANETHLYAPLLGNQGVYGVIHMISSTIIELNEMEIAFIAQVGQTAGRAVESVTLHEDAGQLIADLRMINNVIHQLNSNLAFDELIKILKNELLKICKASEIGFVYFHDNSPTNYEVLAESTSYFHSQGGERFIKWLHNQKGECIEPIISTDFTKEYTNFPYRSLILIPMNRSDFNYGFIALSHEREGFFSFEGFKLMKHLVSHSTLALTNTVLKEQLERIVNTDYLTQLYARNYLDKRLNSHMEKDERGTFLLFDIDDFKSINDTYGHHIGDKVIKQIADVIRKSISANDFPARWGGEEFAVYLPHDHLKQGIEIAEKIRRKVARQTNPAVTVSCGISTWSTQYIDSASAIFIRADKSLYKAKEKGKNRTVTERELWDFVKK